MSKKKLIKAVDQYLTRNDSLFFPDGIYGGTAYLIYSDGFRGPFFIPDYVVPASFSDEAYSNFMKKLEEAGLTLEDTPIDELLEYTEDLDLSYDDEWDLDPEDFIRMIQADCEPDVLYLMPPEFDYEDFYSFIEDAISENCPFEEWETLDKDEIDNWISILGASRSS